MPQAKAPGAETQPRRFQPMMATSGTLPRDPQAWWFEYKWDGVRAMACVKEGRLCLESRNGANITDRYPELAGLSEAVPARVAVLDGEVVALDETGRPSFGALQHRMHVASELKARQLARRNPVVYMLFDVLHLDGEDLCDRPYHERRRILEGLGLDSRCWKVPGAYPAEGRAVLEAARGVGLEGIMAKRADSRYRPGQRSPDWIKIKFAGRQEFVIAGWLPGSGALSGMLGALLVGYFDEAGQLHCAGKVGTGFTDADRVEVCRRLEPLRRPDSPFLHRPRYPEARYVEPRLVTEVEFRGWTSGGHLRQPSYKGLREDRDPREVIREPYDTGTE